MARPFLTSLVLLALVGCAGVSGGLTVADDTSLGDETANALPPERSQESLEKEAFYSKIEGDLLARGLLRADGGGPDTPFTDEMLARNFLAVAFSEEFSEAGGLISARPRQSTLHRWSDPIEMSVVFGETVDPRNAEQDRAQIEGYADRLSRITGHSIGFGNRATNYTVFIVHDQTLRTLGPELLMRLPEISDTEIEFVQTLPLEAYCIVLTSDPGNTGDIARAVAIIRAELPPALRTACIHEDVAQGLGLANDSDFARPSIFKDDDEFGRLTTHDELLLSILYDDRLTPGMTEAEAAPIVREIARALTEPAI